jgi:hypothetical protein
LSELVAYLALASEDPESVIDATQAQRARWIDAEGTTREAAMPLVVFTRSRRGMRSV